MKCFESILSILGLLIFCIFSRLAMAQNEPSIPSQLEQVASSTTTTCGNNFIEDGEGCDAGCENSETKQQCERGSENCLCNDEADIGGCQKGCVKPMAGWNCTSYDKVNEQPYSTSAQEANYVAAEQQAKDLYKSLSDAQETTYKDNDCSKFYTGDDNTESVCLDYQDDLQRFEYLNYKILVDCTANAKFLKKRPDENGALPGYLEVNCNK